MLPACKRISRNCVPHCATVEAPPVDESGAACPVPRRGTARPQRSCSVWHRRRLAPALCRGRRRGSRLRCRARRRRAARRAACARTGRGSAAASGSRRDQRVSAAIELAQVVAGVVVQRRSRADSAFGVRAGSRHRGERHHRGRFAWWARMASLAPFVSTRRTRRSCPSPNNDVEDRYEL